MTLTRRQFLQTLGLAGAGVSLSALTACRRIDQPQPVTALDTPEGQTGEVISAFLAHPVAGSFDPLTATSPTIVAMWRHSGESLTDWDPASGELAPSLAANLPRQIGPTEWEVRIRDGAAFSTGEAVTADDVAWNINRAAHSGDASPLGLFYGYIQSAQAKGDRTVRILLHRPHQLLAEDLTGLIITAQDADFDSHPVGSGPFTLSMADPSHIIMEKNPRYNGPWPARVDRLEWTATSEQQGRVEALKTGQVNAIQTTPIDAFAPGGALAGSGFDTTDNPSLGQLYILFNCSTHPFDIAANRQALLTALDAPIIRTHAAGGRGEIARAVVPESYAGFHPAAKAYAAGGTAVASAAIRAAGLAGTRLTLRCSDDPLSRIAANLVGDAWQAAGVKCTVSPIVRVPGERRTANQILFEEIDQGGDFDVVLGFTDPSIFGRTALFAARWFFLSEKWMAARARVKGTPEYNTAHAAIIAATEAASEARQQATAEALDAIADLAALYPLVFVNNATTWQRDQLDNFGASLSTMLDFRGVARTNVGKNK